MTERAVVIACPKCPVKLKLKGDVAGKKVKCPKCEAVFKIGGVKLPADDSQLSASPAPISSRVKRTSTEASKPAAAKPRPGKANADPSATGRASSKSLQSRKPKSAGKTALDAHSGGTKRPKKKKKPVAQDSWNDDGYDDFSNENYGVDDFGGRFDDDYDDGYQDFGAQKHLPARKTRKKKSSGSKSKKTNAINENGFQTKLYNLGFFGWLISGGIAGAVAVGLTTLTGFTNFGFLTSIMSIVTGSMVGGAVRFAAQSNHGVGPGIVGVLIALVAILVGKTCSWYVWFSHNSDPEDAWTLRDDIEYETSEDALIVRIADEVQAEWLKTGKITEAQMEQHWETAYEELPEDWEEDAEVESEAADFSMDYLPAVWAEAKNQWNGKSDEERQAIKDTAIREVKANWLGEEFADLSMAEAEQAAAEQEDSGKLTVAMIAAIGNCFLPLHALFCFCSGLFGAFKLSAGMVG